MTATVHDARVCDLGEGPLWHPELKRLFWFDILGRALLCDDGRMWPFEEYVSAAGWIDAETLLIASETSLFRFNFETTETEIIAPLEAEKSITRSNDGRADPWGGFWIGTMGKRAEDGVGAIYRLFHGEVIKLFDRLTIPNSICFAPDRDYAFYTDTARAVIKRVALDRDGFPQGDGDDFLDLTAEGLKPDGSVVLADGTLLNAQWGAGRVAHYDAFGAFIEAFKFPASQMTCPAVGGGKLFATSAAHGVTGEAEAGKTFTVTTALVGQEEHRIIL